MLDKTLSKNKPKNYKFVIITLDSHSAGPVARVQAKLKPYFPTLEITVHAAAEWAENPKSLEIAKDDILNADIIIANLLFLEEEVFLMGQLVRLMEIEQDQQLVVKLVRIVLQKQLMDTF